MSIDKGHESHEYKLYKEKKFPPLTQEDIEQAQREFKNYGHFYGEMIVPRLIETLSMEMQKDKKPIQDNPGRFNSGYPELDIAFKDIQEDQLELFCKKQKDYGPGNINAFGELGILVRMNDKMERLKNLFLDKETGLPRETQPANESIDDTLMDMATYPLIALLVRRGLWPK